MKFLTSVSLLASVASALSVTRRSEPLAVKLELIGNTEVKALITNTGNDLLKVFKTGTFLTDFPTEKVKVFQGDSQVPFTGIRLRVNTAGLDEESFQAIEAGQTVEATFDIAQLHDLSAGGDFDIVASGVLSYAEGNSTEIVGVVPFSSNSISATVNGIQARQVHQTFHDKRSIVQSDCTSTKKTKQVAALANCKTLATAAGSAAGTNSAKVIEYFKSASAASTLKTVFAKVATECGSTTSGVAKQYCTDVYSSCGSNVLAYTLPSGSFMVSCPLYFSALPALTKTCHAQDQATTTLHEVTHLTQIKGTDDLGYGYAAATKLSMANALNNADSYALFANAIYAGC